MLIRAVWKDEEKPFPLCFITFLFYELVSWMINQRYCKPIILWGKPPWNFPFCAILRLSKRKIPKTKHKLNAFDLWWLLGCGWHPNKMPSALFIISSNCGFAKEKEKKKLPEIIIAFYKYPLSSWQLDNPESNYVHHYISLRHLNASESAFVRSLITVTWPSPVAGHTGMALFAFANKRWRYKDSQLSSLIFTISIWQILHWMHPFLYIPLYFTPSLIPIPLLK